MHTTFTEQANDIFNKTIDDYHLTDNVDEPIRNPYERGTIEFDLYLKNWIDTVQWHLEDIIRDPAIDPVAALEGMQGERGKDWRTTHGKQGTAWCKHFSHNKTFRYGQAGASLGRKESFPRVENNFPSRGKKLFLGREIWLTHLSLQGTGACVRIFPIRATKPGG